MYKNSRDERIQPKWLPQMEADISYIKEMLNKEGIQYEVVQVDPKSLNPLQKSVSEKKVNEIYESIEQDSVIHPAFVSAENDMLYSPIE